MVTMFQIARAHVTDVLPHECDVTTFYSEYFLPVIHIYRDSARLLSIGYQSPYFIIEGSQAPPGLGIPIGARRKFDSRDPNFLDELCDIVFKALELCDRYFGIRR